MLRPETSQRPGTRTRRLQARWRLAHPVPRIVLQAAVVAVSTVAAFAFLTMRSQINETAASVLVAVVFGVATVLQVRQTQRRQHTIELVTAFQGSEVLAAADTWMASRIASRREVEADIAVDAGGGHLITMLDYYEFLAALALRGHVDVRLLLNLRGGAMMRAFDISRTYIEHRRRVVGPELYRSFEVFVEEFSRRSGHPFRDRVLPAGSPARALDGAPAEDGSPERSQGHETPRHQAQGEEAPR